MMRRHLLGMACLLLGVLLVSGLAACTPTSTSQTSQSDTSQANPPGAANEPSAAARTSKREAVRKQIEAVLTPEQLQQLKTKLQQGEKMRQALQELNLQDAQKTKIRDILRTAYPHRQHQSQQG